jgi:hypothetical protein
MLPFDISCMPLMSVIVSLRADRGVNNSSLLLKTYRIVHREEWSSIMTHTRDQLLVTLAVSIIDGESGPVDSHTHSGVNEASLASQIIHRGVIPG